MTAREVQVGHEAFAAPCPGGVVEHSSLRTRDTRDTWHARDPWKARARTKRFVMKQSLDSELRDGRSPGQRLSDVHRLGSVNEGRVWVHFSSSHKFFSIEHGAIDHGEENSKQVVRCGVIGCGVGTGSFFFF